MWFPFSTTECSVLSSPGCPLSLRSVCSSRWLGLRGILVPGAGERSLGWTGWGRGAEPGKEVAVQWGPLDKRAWSYTWVGPPEVGH